MILVLDFGAQYSQLIARKIREFGVYSKIVPYNISSKELTKLNPNALIFSGGPENVLDDQSPRIDDKILDLGIPILGICYGMQLLSYIAGGSLVNDKNMSEYGQSSVKIDNTSLLFDKMDETQSVWMSHGISVTGFTQTNLSYSVIAKNDKVPVLAIENKEKKIYGLQWHPEVFHTKNGDRIFENFLFKIVKVTKNWLIDDIIKEKIDSIKKTVSQGENVICGLSGGVDSSVAATLVHKAIGDRLTCIFVDNGLLRLNEVLDVKNNIIDKIGINTKIIDDGHVFLDKLKGVGDPELKRKIIGEQFIRSFEKGVSNIKNAKWLVQGTLYPDVVESGLAGLKTKNIKSHHNVGGLPKDNNFSLIEPLKDLFKDEVRKIGSKLGLDDSIINRHPFPGPSLSIRIVGEITSEKLNILKKADYIVRDELTKNDLYDKVWQFPVILLSTVKSVGVAGDDRTYQYPVVLRPVTSVDGMTADWAKLPYDFLDKVSSRITNEVDGVNRVILDITSKPPATIEWE